MARRGNRLLLPRLNHLASGPESYATLRGLRGVGNRPHAGADRATVPPSVPEGDGSLPRAGSESEMGQGGWPAARVCRPVRLVAEGHGSPSRVRDGSAPQDEGRFRSPCRGAVRSGESGGVWVRGWAQRHDQARVTPDVPPVPPRALPGQHGGHGTMTRPASIAARIVTLSVNPSLRHGSPVQ